MVPNRRPSSAPNRFQHLAYRSATLLIEGSSQGGPVDQRGRIRSNEPICGRLLVTETPDVVIRRQLRPGDVDAIVHLHDRVYRTEYGAGEDWVELNRLAIERAVARGWPRERALGSLWLVELGGCWAARWRWCGSVRGSATSIGSCLLPNSAAVDSAVGSCRVGRRGARPRHGETESRDLQRAHGCGPDRPRCGFEIVWEKETDWYGDRVIHQLYELTLSASRPN
jgi:hypothetical protein